ncbi:MAG: LysR family transcriptional regulator [Candidatus Heimdallarchaeota archaeon]|nr:LysR family transcriptional regulator [Candidatus Heimdallarchaeota archaeon]
MKGTSDRLTIKFKIWFEKQGDIEAHALGEKKIELLKTIDTLGSIKKSADHLSIDYKLAWDMINNMNSMFEDVEFVISRRGRSGGASLTDYGKSIIDKYEEAFSKMNNYIDNID